ncbi:hypothetical protein [Streptomyces sp. NBC_00344]|uniref:hypothetical protein n=1 Tax=Streptomyces sp. NBC_00344 TaxID=2975720 RepID=UPI002E1F92D4
MLLPERERYIAGYVDHLPDGAPMDIKTLARNIPLYGQMAVGSALRALTVAGHLRHARCRVGESESRWVTLTYWSRTARDNAWWDVFAEAENGRAAREAAPAETVPPSPWAPTDAPTEQTGAEAPVAPPEHSPRLAPPAPVLTGPSALPDLPYRGIEPWVRPRTDSRPPISPWPDSAGSNPASASRPWTAGHWKSWQPGGWTGG